MHVLCALGMLGESRDITFLKNNPQRPIYLKGEVQSRITIISKERVKIPLQIGANMMKIG